MVKPREESEHVDSHVFSCSKGQRQSMRVNQKASGWSWGFAEGEQKTEEEAIYDSCNRNICSVGCCCYRLSLECNMFYFTVMYVV